MTRARSLSRLANSTVFTVSDTNRVGIGSTIPDVKLDVDGKAIIDDTTQTTSVSTGALVVSGGVGIGKSLFIGGDMSVAGTLTYEDVTNTETAGITTTGGLVVTGLGATFGSISTHFSNIEFGAAGVGGTITPLGHAEFAGVVTASSFSGDGSGLTGVASTDNINTSTLAQFTGGVGIADSIFHIGDDNTAIRFPGNDTFTVETGGDERLRVNSSGELLLGATSSTNLIRHGQAFAVATTTEFGGGSFTGFNGTTANEGPIIDLQRSRATSKSPGTVVANNDRLGSLVFRGDDGTDFADAAYMLGEVDGTPNGGFVPGRFTFYTGTTSSTPIERLRIDSSGFITQKFTSNNSTTAEGLFINNQQNTTGNNASLIFSNDSGNRKKAALALIDTGDYGSGDLVFALDGADSGELNLTNDEKLRITSAGIVTVSSGGSLAIPAVPGANTNADMPVLFQSTTGLIDGGSGLVYNPAEDSLKVNGNTINSQEFRGSGDDVKLTAANSSSTSFFFIDAGVPKISMASDKVIQFSASIGEIGNVTGFQATNTAASANTDFGIRATTIRFATGNSERCRVTDSGFMPDSNDARDLGSTSLRWANVFTADLQLSNESKKDTGGNDVDGTWGDYTIQEGENDLFLLNRRNGKKFKFMLQEVS